MVISMLITQMIVWTYYLKISNNYYKKLTTRNCKLRALRHLGLFGLATTRLPVLCGEGFCWFNRPIKRHILKGKFSGLWPRPQPVEKCWEEVSTRVHKCAYCMNKTFLYTEQVILLKPIQIILITRNHSHINYPIIGINNLTTTILVCKDAREFGLEINTLLMTIHTQIWQQSLPVQITVSLSIVLL